MTHQSKLWLGAAAAIAVATIAIVITFGLSFPPGFASLYEGGPAIEGHVAYVDYGHDDCVRVLDVATGDSEELYCDDSLWLEGWDRDGNVRIHADDGRHEQVLVVDPASGDVIASGDFAGFPPPHTPQLRAFSDDGRVGLLYRRGDTEVALIDVAGPRDYHFWDYGLTPDGSYAWACDSADRLVVVAVDGSGGPWLVADGISEMFWK